MSPAIRFILFTFFSLLVSEVTGQTPEKKETNPGKKTVYLFKINREIGPPVRRQTLEAFREARDLKVDLIVINLNTYGGAVDAADDIRTEILKSQIPVVVYIENNAASAGALISIACDSIYMDGGATIGAATVVDGSGKPAPEKYQSYMRSKLRATAEENGRDPRIAEGMNDSAMVIPGIKEAGRIITFTASEAHKYGEAILNNIEEVIARNGITNYEIHEYKPGSIGKIIDWLIDPFVSGILIMIIIGGIYFELQTPGVGFPLMAAIAAAILYFAPHYLEGLAAHWEILIFVVGLILLGLEIFVIPGFGIAGISGIVLIVLGLALTLVGALPSDRVVDLPDWEQLFRALFIVVVSLILSIGISFYLGGKAFNSRIFSKLEVAGTQKSSEGYNIVNPKSDSLKGREALAYSDLRPSGKIELDGDLLDATAESGYIEKGSRVKIIRTETYSLVVRKVHGGA
jgi:membrane-bound serine protease (ClpP class)